MLPRPSHPRQGWAPVHKKPARSFLSQHTGTFCGFRSRLQENREPVWWSMAASDWLSLIRTRTWASHWSMRCLHNDALFQCWSLIIFKSHGEHLNSTFRRMFLQQSNNFEWFQVLIPQMSEYFCWHCSHLRHQLIFLSPRFLRLKVSDPISDKSVKSRNE